MPAKRLGQGCQTNLVLWAIFTHLDFTRARQICTWWYNRYFHLLFLHSTATRRNVTSFGIYKNVNIWYQRLCSRRFCRWAEMRICQLRSVLRLVQVQRKQLFVDINTSEHWHGPRCHSFYLGISWSNVLIKRFGTNIFKSSFKNTVALLTQFVSIWYFRGTSSALPENGLLKTAKPVFRSLKSANRSSKRRK